MWYLNVLILVQSCSLVDIGDDHTGTEKYKSQWIKKRFPVMILRIINSDYLYNVQENIERLNSSHLPHRIDSDLL